MSLASLKSVPGLAGLDKTAIAFDKTATAAYGLDKIAIREKNACTGQYEIGNPQPKSKRSRRFAASGYLIKTAIGLAWS